MAYIVVIRISRHAPRIQRDIAGTRWFFFSPQLSDLKRSLILAGGHFEIFFSSDYSPSTDIASVCRQLDFSTPRYSERSYQMAIAIKTSVVTPRIRRPTPVYYSVPGPDTSHKLACAIHVIFLFHCIIVRVLRTRVVPRNESSDSRLFSCPIPFFILFSSFRMMFIAELKGWRVACVVEAWNNNFILGSRWRFFVVGVVRPGDNRTNWVYLCFYRHWCVAGVQKMVFMSNILKFCHVYPLFCRFMIGQAPKQNFITAITSKI